jgi:hypothetical protein
MHKNIEKKNLIQLYFWRLITSFFLENFVTKKKIISLVFLSLVAINFAKYKKIYSYLKTWSQIINLKIQNFE